MVQAIPFIPFKAFVYKGKPVESMEDWCRDRGEKIVLVRLWCRRGEYLSEVPESFLSELVLKFGGPVKVISRRP